MHSLRVLAIVASGILPAMTLAAPVTYKVDGRHTYPSFEADHLGGMSVWRGKFNQTSGTITLDRDAKSGSIDITIDAASVDTGNDDLNKDLKSKEFFDVTKFPTVKYKGKFTKFADGKPTEVTGELTLHGVTKPVTLTIRSFKCMPHPMNKKEFCGADVTTTINREDFGVSVGKNLGFKMDVKLDIQVETEPVG
jgi:polyisoprenoid-binding protein YceI